jgi:lipopolysaccharide export system protein LptA
VDRRRLLKVLFSTLFTGFLLLLAYKFKPKLDMPAPGPPETERRTPRGTLSAKGFRYVQQSGSKVEFEITAASVSEGRAGTKLLTEPVMTIPGQGKAWAREGSFEPSTQTLRIWDDAHVSHAAGWDAASSGFRLTPEGEILSEGDVALSRLDARGWAELLRYQRKAQVAYLEGKVRFEQADKRLTCSRIIVDFSLHSGQIVGPVEFTSLQGDLRAPEGTLALSEKNELTGVSLGSPCTGEGPRGSFSARTLTADLGERGALTALHLRREAVVRLAGPAPTTLRTALLDIIPSEKESWTWTAPQALTVEREGGKADAASGTGVFGGSAQPSADLAGPVTGKDARGTFRGDRASLEGGDWTLTGHAVVQRPEDWVKADAVTYRQDGSSSASGNVTGWRKPKDQPEFTFASDRADAGAGGFPAVLEGRAKAARDGLDLAAKRIRIRDADTSDAEGDAVAVFRAKDGSTQRVRADLLRFEGREHRAAAEGNARAEGRDYRVEAPKILAFLDEKNAPVRYETEGDSRFDGPAYEGRADRLLYEPATQAGRAYGKGRNAVVIQKDPYRRMSGPAIAYAPRRFEVLPAEQASLRGSLEGVQPPQEKKTAASPTSSPKPQEGKTDGR